MEYFVCDFSGVKRLDIALTEQESISSRSYAKRLIQKGAVEVNGSSGKVTPKTKVKFGDKVGFQIIKTPVTDLIPVPYDLDIVYEDDHLIVVNKPKGMVVHPACGHQSDTLVNYLLHHTKLSDVDAERPGIVHRIDKDTSGLLVVAKDVATHEHLAGQFFDHSVSRKYQAIVWGVPDRMSGTVDAPLGRHPVDRKKFAVREGGKHAVTHWKMIRSFDHLSLLECQLETGRTHQIRVHMNSIGHSLLGDPVYGRHRNYSKVYSSEVLQLLKSSQGQALHAKTIGFEHPQRKEWLEFDTNLPEEMTRILNALKQEK